MNSEVIYSIKYTECKQKWYSILMLSGECNVNGEDISPRSVGITHRLSDFMLIFMREHVRITVK